KAKELGLELDGPTLSEVVDTLKRLVPAGYHFEAADGSLELLLRRAGGWEQDFFRMESFRVITDEIGDRAFITEATVKVHVGGERKVATAEGNGPVNALDKALRLAIGARFPVLEPIHPPGHWKADRPADLRGGQPRGPMFGDPGPDQGYALVLARRFEDRLQLTEGEHREDVVAGCVGVANKRSSLLGRAPVIYDL